MFYTPDPIQLAMSAGSASIVPNRVCVMCFRTATDVGCIIMKRSFPATARDRPVMISQIGPLYSLGPQSESSLSGELTIQDSRAPHALVVPEDIGNVSSSSPIRAESLMRSMLV